MPLLCNRCGFNTRGKTNFRAYATANKPIRNMISPTIGPLHLSELSAAATLIQGVITPLEYYTPEARNAEVAKYTSDELEALATSDPLSVIVARSGGELVGFCISKYDDGIIWLAWFGVREDQRGMGISSELLRVLETRTRDCGCHKVWCDTRTTNLRSQHVLGRSGFSRTCTLENHWYGQDFYIWEKLVESQP